MQISEKRMIPLNMDNNSTDDIFDLNFKQSNCDNNCRHKKIDDVTKNTINDILDSVLNDMKSSKNKYNKRYMKKNNKITSKYRLRTINIDQRIETIEEEDKESSTSEVNKNEKKNEDNEEVIVIEDDDIVNERKTSGGVLFTLFKNDKNSRGIYKELSKKEFKDRTQRKKAYKMFQKLAL